MKWILTYELHICINGQTFLLVEACVYKEQRGRVRRRGAAAGAGRGGRGAADADGAATAADAAGRAARAAGAGAGAPATLFHILQPGLPTLFFVNI